MIFVFEIPCFLFNSIITINYIFSYFRENKDKKSSTNGSLDKTNIMKLLNVSIQF